MNDLPQWHSIRPWRPTLSLSVREITSVSATFILSSALRTSADAAIAEQSLASLGLTNDDDGSDGDSSNAGPQIVSDVLSKGLSVKVNGTPWQRVLMRIDDEADEAVIILFGLMPGRQYDIELGIVPNEKTLRSQITTATNVTHTPLDTSSNHDSAAAELTFADSNSQALSPSSSQLESPHSASEAHPPSPLPTFSLEDRRLQLSHKLSLLTAEHATLTSTLKAARRDAQKADAALRAEIDALRKASERTIPADNRARQKVLALQEAVRQASTAADQVQARIEECEEALPQLVARRDEVEREWQKVRKDADAVRARREEAELREKKRAEAKQSELAGLAARLEKLSVRKEKLDGEGGVLNDLEEKLKHLEEERQRVEGDPYGYSYEEFVVDDEDEVVTPNRDENQQQHTHRPHAHGHHQHSHPRKRHTHPLNSRAPQPIARPEPIQRPPQGNRNASATSNGSTATLPPGPGVIHLHHAHTSSLPSSRRPAPAPAPSIAGSSSGTSGSSASPSPSPAHALSSRAPPFEPRAGSVKSDLNPGSSPFEPRTAGAGAKAEAFKKSPGTGRP